MSAYPLFLLLALSPQNSFANQSPILSRIYPVYSESSLPAALASADTRSEAFEQVVRMYSPRLYTAIRHIVTWHDDADDVLQNTYLRAWRALDSFRGDANVYTWLYRIAINESISFVTRTMKNSDLPSAEFNDEAKRIEADPYFDGDELLWRLEAAILTLPARQQLVFRLKYFEERKYEEISQLLGVTVGALKASYHLAVKKIEQYFDE